MQAHALLTPRAIMRRMLRPNSIAQVLAINLRNLLRIGVAHGLPGSQAELARRTGISQKAISNWLAPERGVAPVIDSLEPIAALYGLEVWQLLVPDLPDDMLLASHLKRLVANYRHINSAAAREYIDRVAEAEAGYTPKARR